MIFKLIYIVLLICYAFIPAPAKAADYIYRDLMGNSLASQRCDAEAAATQAAAKPYNIDRFAKRFCQSQGYGWHVEEIKNPGKTICISCDGATNLKTCHQEDIEVSCKRIKPGSVGMLPGRG